MVSLSDAITLAIDRARSSPTHHHSVGMIRSGALQQTVVALLEGTELAEHESDVPGSVQILHGAIRVVADEPFVLEGGALHELPGRRRAVVALADTVMLLTAVTAVPPRGAGPEGSGESEEIDYTLPRA